MNFYQAYNLCIGSEITLPELDFCSDHQLDVIVELGRVEIYNCQDKNNKNCITGTLQGLAKVAIIDGKKIILEPLPGINKSWLSSSIINGCMAVILRQRGYFVLHASSIIINGKAIAFIGNSGAGKSTLAAFFAEKQYQVLTDDVMAIKFQDEQCFVIPSYPVIKLRHHTVNALYGDSHSTDIKNKFFYSLHQSALDQAFPLKTIYVLAIDEYHHIDCLTTQQKFIELLRHTRAIKLLQDDCFVSCHLTHCTKLMNNVAVRKFHRKPGFSEFPELIKLVEKDSQE